ncbi:acid phosphatase pho5 [Pichia californica]|uniref:Acid phosphatase pho5 n=1 Tax=Pichia californica TaxID=460514 RepID=A0A9P6WIP0_9ASCO|nr:acid phosphatase pho5 [[Candida] californica]
MKAVTLVKTFLYVSVLFMPSYSFVTSNPAIMDHYISTAHTDQSNLLKHLGGMGPYIKGTGFGLTSEFDCDNKPDKVFVFARHGERYPTKPVAKKLKTLFNKLKKNYNENVEGPLCFIKDWEFFIPGSDWAGMMTLYGDFNGFQTMYDFGKSIRLKYGYLYEGCDDQIPIFTAGKEVCVDSAEEFGKGFFNDDILKFESNVKIIKLDETKKMGADTLTTSVSCKKYIRIDDYYKHPFTGKFMINESKRLNALSPGFDLTPKDIYIMSIYCAFELNAIGESRLCDILSMNTFVEMEYFKDSELWYGKASHPYSFTLGSIYVDAMIRLFDNQETKENFYFSFTHDSELIYFMSALGIFQYQKENLSTRKIDFERFFKSSELIPMGARIVVERYTIKNERYIRVLINDVVIPIPECQNGPFFTCKLSNLRAILSEKMLSEDFAEKCRITEERPRNLTFYWDWRDRC